MAKAPKMVRLAVDETSGVDHPAHLSEGWLVMKSADAEAIEAVIDSLTESVVKNDNDSITEQTKEDSVSDENKNTEDAVVTEATAKAVADQTTESLAKANARIIELEEELEKMKQPKKKPMKMEDKMEDESDEDYMARLRSMKKEAPAEVVKAIESLEKSVSDANARAEMAEATLKKERDERADVDAIAKAKNWANLPIDAEKVGPALRRLSVIDEELAKSLEGILSAVNEQAKTANLFTEIGKAVDSTATDAYSRLTALAKSAVDSGIAGSFEQAMADAALANQDLYKQYLSEKGA